MSKVYTICRCCVTDGVPRRSFVCAIIVGAVLNLIKQEDILFGGGHLDVAKLLLTFAVPYFVATYGAVSLRMKHVCSNESKRVDAA
jgi:hypothetical protein